jgi:hypothetical protein
MISGLDFARFGRKHVQQKISLRMGNNFYQRVQFIQSNAALIKHDAAAAARPTDQRSLVPYHACAGRSVDQKKELHIDQEGAI